MGRAKSNFSLKVDSIMIDAYREETMLEWADVKQELDVPYNSIYTEDEYVVYESPSDDEVQEIVVVKKTEVQKFKPFDLKVLDVTPFRMESMRYYPYRTKEGDIPLKLLKMPTCSFVIECAPRI